MVKSLRDIRPARALSAIGASPGAMPAPYLCFRGTGDRCVKDRRISNQGEQSLKSLGNQFLAHGALRVAAARRDDALLVCMAPERDDRGGPYRASYHSRTENRSDVPKQLSTINSIVGDFSKTIFQLKFFEFVQKTRFDNEGAVAHVSYQRGYQLVFVAEPSETGETPPAQLAGLSRRFGLAKLAVQSILKQHLGRKPPPSVPPPKTSGTLAGGIYQTLVDIANRSTNYCDHLPMDCLDSECLSAMEIRLRQSREAERPILIRNFLRKYDRILDDTECLNAHLCSIIIFYALCLTSADLSAISITALLPSIAFQLMAVFHFVIMVSSVESVLKEQKVLSDCWSWGRDN
ncbi:unnamed protein product [Nesidiocoris tenuis]|uniref:Uncharacterized protein n=1 Tax=Nesidiocoris tenuis TaxID=355587 RepID=A0A6H5GA71_9HEMI|nr:unnamed protein product [Nesidiocoris tenuis]